MKYDFNKRNGYLLPLLAFMFAGFNHTALAQQPPVVVKTFGQHFGGNIVYQQQVTNNGNRDVVRISVGENADTDRGELKALPVGSSMFKLKINPASITGPTGWTAEIIQIQDGGRFLQWYSPDYTLSDIQPGQTIRLSVTVPKYDEAYLSGHFSAGFPVDDGPRYYNGVMEKLDVTPPSLTVILTPSTLRPNGKLVPITATITVKDDYDPAPEIKLESITPSEMAEPGDIRDAQLGTDDRQFMLRAESRGRNKAGRSYTVIYSATDASGNKTTASATVTVPHDERGDEDHHHDSDKNDRDDHKRER